VSLRALENASLSARLRNGATVFLKYIWRVFALIHFALMPVSRYTCNSVFDPCHGIFSAELPTPKITQPTPKPANKFVRAARCAE
jgi:hypothetical protein